MEKETSKKARRPITRLETSPARRSPQLPAADVFPSSRHGDGSQPAVTVASANRKVSKQEKWIELLRLEHSRPSPEEIDETVETAPRERPSRAKDASGKDGDISTPLSPYEYWRSQGPDAASPAAPFLSVPHSPYSGAQRSLRIPDNGSGVTTLTATPAGAQSHQWLTPQESTPLSPGLTGSPPRIRVLVSPTAAPPKAQPYDGFPGVPTYIGAPEVIVFTPRFSPSGAATPVRTPDAVPDTAHQQDPVELSHPIQGTGVGDAAEINKRARLTLLQVWALSTAAAGTLSLPLGLFILTYVSTGSGGKSGTLPTAGRPAVSFTGFASPSVITPGPFSGVPARCLRSVRLNDPNVSIVSTTYTPTGFQRTLHQIFCVFNVSRLGRANSMTPIDMPLDYCSSIVYWSLGVVASGAVESRVEQFDSTGVGLYKWRDMLDRIGLQDTRIMLTIGGYPQESAYFSRLGRDSGAMARFVTSLMKIVLKSYANGIVIDWVQPEPGCGRPEDRITLSLLIDAIRLAYRTSAAVVGGGEIAVTISKHVVLAREVMILVADRVDWFFAQTQLIEPSTAHGVDLCFSWAQAHGHVIGSLRGRGLYVEKICAGFSMAPLLAEGWQDRGRLPVVNALSSATSPDTGRATTSMVNVCSSPMDPPCKVTSNAGCLIFRKLHLPGNASFPAPFYIFEGRDLMHTSLSIGNVTTKFCAVLYDLDFDNFRTPCPALNAGVFAGLSHLVSVTVDPRSTSDLQLQPYC
ncbi:hypothetical protein HPB50_005164 [Hyalomma asiaticum]|uniref:Uncharacterized protein n=1 Tax=Hyalomma asiaticum TaxID=266040 RepID=A0ACB7RT58_HYAAI|nr:hypothetical protein HPB50_005164 [Hyalomma asiaticum]